jgi:lipopolysaccharide export LptBFGC system permease protein LptF
MKFNVHEFLYTLMHGSIVWFLALIFSGLGAALLSPYFPRMQERAYTYTICAISFLYFIAVFRALE